MMASGYEHQWLEEPPDDFKCLICLCVARNPHQHGSGGCGKLFCKNCVKELIKKKQRCPNCRKPLAIFKDERSSRQIRALKLRCANPNCPWEGELRQLENHYETCDYVYIPCPNECDIDAVLRKDLQDHLTNECSKRPYQCPHCEEMGTYLERTTTHLEVCPKVKIQCPNEQCPVEIPRSEIFAHQSTCDYKLLPCTNECMKDEQIVRVLRKDILDHLTNKCPKRLYECPHCEEVGEYQERTTTHLQTCPKREVFCPTYRCLVRIPRCEISNHLETCEYVRLPCTNECRNDDGLIVKIRRRDFEEHLANWCPRREYQCPHCEEVGEYQERTTSHLETCEMVCVNCPNEGCEVSVPRYEIPVHQAICDYEPELCKYAEIGCEEMPARKDLQSHEENSKFHLKLTTNMIWELKDQIEELKEIIEEQKEQIEDQKEQLEDQKEQIEEQNAQIKLLSTSEKTQSGCITFKLTRFKKHLDNNVHYYSPPFYSAPNGYKLCIRVYVNGVKPGHISVYAHLMKGDNDDSLTWPFTGTILIELLNQLDPEKNHHMGAISFPSSNVASRRVEEGTRAKRGYGCPQFISHDRLTYKELYQYLVNDTLTFRSSVV